jgi:hypothetical protein
MLVCDVGIIIVNQKSSVVFPAMRMMLLSLEYIGTASIISRYQPAS